RARPLLTGLLGPVLPRRAGAAAGARPVPGTARAAGDGGLRPQFRHAAARGATAAALRPRPRRGGLLPVTLPAPRGRPGPGGAGGGVGPVRGRGQGPDGAAPRPRQGVGRQGGRARRVPAAPPLGAAGAALQGRSAATTQTLRKWTGLPWFCRLIFSGASSSLR